MDRMDRIMIFQTLGIQETKDLRQLKSAYREKLAVTNPEDDPEGFKRLRRAYDEACRLAEEADGEQEEQPRDTTPSGLWVEKAARIYDNIYTRQDTELWEKLFRDDCFLSLEDEENCRLKLLAFLAGHHRLPTNVWKLLDKRLSIVSGAAKLREQFPADFVRYLLNKCERGEDVEFSQFEGPEDGNYDLFLQFYDQTWQALAEGKLGEAEAGIECADGLGIIHPVMEICRGDLLNRQGKSLEAAALMEKLLKRYPGDAMVAYNTAELLWKQERPEDDRYREQAAEIYRQLKEENDNHYMANARLAEWYYEKGEYRQAKSCAERVLTSGSDEAFMELLIKVNAEIEKGLEQEYRETGKWEIALELCWCYLQDGKIARSIMMAVNIEKQLPPEKEAEFDGLMTKLYVEEAEYEDSITMSYAWEEALRRKLESEESEEEKERDQDRLKQAHLIRMQCYHNLGFRDREQFWEALREGDEVLTHSVKDAGILLEQAQIFLELEEYERCRELVERLVEEYQIYAAYATLLEAYRRQLDAAGVIRTGALCMRYFPGYVKSYEYVAKVYLDLDYREDLEKVLEDAEKNNIRSDILEAYRYQLHHKPMELSILSNKLRHFREKYRGPVERGELFLYEEGLGILTEYLYHCPDTYLFVERGLYHKAARHYEEAKEDFERALSLSPADPYALQGLSHVWKYMGDYEKALICLKKAILYMDEETAASLCADMGRLYSLLGDYTRALAAYVQHKGDSQDSTFLWDLAEGRLRAGDVDGADFLYCTLFANDIWKRNARRVELFVRTGDEQRAREILQVWRQGLKLDKNDPVSRRLRHFNPLNVTMYYSDYFQQAAWVEMIFGDREEALRDIDDMIRFNSVREREEDLLCDAVFACIVCGDGRRGKKYSEKLRNCYNQESCKARDKYYDSPKGKLYVRILSRFYTASPEDIAELLEQEAATAVCDYCTNPFCKELEGVRIMFLVRQGKRREALERLVRNLELFPQEEYMLSIRHTIFGDESM